MCFLGISLGLKMLKRVAFWGAGCLQGREGYLLGIVLVGKVFTNDFPGGNGIYVLGIFWGEGVYKVIFLGAGRS